MNYDKNEFEILPVKTLLRYQTGELSEPKMMEIREIIQSDLKTYGPILDGLEEMLLIYGDELEKEFDEIESKSDVEEWTREAKVEYAKLQQEKKEAEIQLKDTLANLQIDFEKEQSKINDEPVLVNLQRVNDCIHCNNICSEVENCKMRLAEIEDKVGKLNIYEKYTNAGSLFLALFNILRTKNYWLGLFKLKKKDFSELQEKHKGDKKWMDKTHGGYRRMVPNMSESRYEISSANRVN